jgi:hypothetical protein
LIGEQAGSSFSGLASLLMAQTMAPAAFFWAWTALLKRVVQVPQARCWPSV